MKHKRSPNPNRRRKLSLEYLEDRRLLSASGFPGNVCPPDLDLSAILAQEVRAGQSLNFNVFAVGATLEDLDNGGLPTGDTLNLFLDPDPADTPDGAMISRSGDFSWSPTLGQIGSHEIVVIAVDNGSPALADAETFVVEVLPGNDAPSFTLVGDPAAVDEDAGLQSIANFATNISPGGTGEAGQTLQFLVTGNTNSSLFTSGPTIASNGTLTFQSAGNANGTAEVTVVLMDDGGTAFGGADTSSPQTFTITINAVNDAPTIGVPGAQMVAEDTDLSITGISVSDVDVDELPGTGQVEVTLSVVQGVISLNGTTGLTFSGGADGDQDATITFNGLLSDVNTAISNLIYRGNLNFNGTDTLSIEVNDLGNTGSGVNPHTTDSVAITVTAENDEPVVTAPGPQTAFEDEIISIGPITVADVDFVAGTELMQITLAVTNGTLNLATTPAGLSFTDSQGDASMTFTGTLADIATALTSVRYQASPGFIGPVTLTVTADDLGVAGAPGPRTGAATVLIDVVEDSNNFPLIDPIDPQQAFVGREFTLTVTGSDSDGDNLTFQLDDSSPDGATIGPTTNNGDGTASAVITWTPTEFQAGMQTIGLLVTDDGVPPKSNITSFAVDVGLVVDTSEDGSDGDFSSGEFSLREAIEIANSSPGFNTITFDPSLSEETIALAGTELVVTEALIIDASALNENVIVDAQQNSRVFNFTTSTGDFTLAGLTLTGGRTTGGVANGRGGAIRSVTRGNLTLDQSTVSGNSTAGSGADGGGIVAYGDVTLTQSTASGNSTAGNSADGGGIFAFGDVTLTQSTISGNSTAESNAYGGGIYAFGAVTLTQSTVTDNHANHSGVTGGGIWNDNNPIMISGSILAGNTAGRGSNDLDPGTGTLTVNYSLIGTEITPDVGTSGNNISNNNPGLGPLADNGGPTQTHALMAGSPAIDAGDPSILFDMNEFDQRGAPFVRVFDDPTATGSGIDIGAYELLPTALVVSTNVDENDGDYSAGDLALREAILLANAIPGANSITFDAGLSDATILLDGTELEITEALTIDAGGLAQNVTIDAQQNSRIFNIDDPGVTNESFDVTLAGLTLTGGKTTGANVNSLDDDTFSGGAIRSLTLGSLAIESSTITGSGTTGFNARGAGVFASGNVRLANSTLAGNNTTGLGARGGGIYTFSGDVTLINSTLSGNSTSGANDSGGGGIITYSGAVTLTNSTLSENSSSGAGGGIRTDSGAVTLTNSILSGNRGATGGDGAFGGGILTGSGAVTLINSTLSGNSSTSGANDSVGGGIVSSSGDVSLTNSTLSENSSSGAGGGIFSGSGAVTLTNSTLSGNRTTVEDASGGGIFSVFGPVTLTNSTLSGNGTSGDNAHGGGIYTFSSDVMLTNSTVSGNSTSGTNSDGGGIFIRDMTFSSLTIINSIVAGNMVAAGNQGPDIIPNPAGALTVEYSLIGDTSDSGINVGTGTGNILNVDPMLEELAHNGGPTRTHALMAGSPAIDAGDPLFAAPPDFDQRGVLFTRVFDGDATGGSRIDIGAYEFQTFVASALNVSTTDDIVDGILTSGNVSLREAIEVANGNPGFDTVTFDPAFVDGGTIFLDMGEMKIGEALTIDATNLPSGITVDAQERSRIFNITAETGDFSLAGLTLTGGKTTDINGRGGAVRSLSTGDLTINLSTISDSSTEGISARGGGIYSRGKLIVSNSIVSGNSTTGDSAGGGGLAVYNEITIVDSTVTANSTHGENSRGGALSGADISLTSSVLSGNHTTGKVSLGGAVRANVLMSVDTSLYGNYTTGQNANGGAIQARSRLELIDSIVTGNSTSDDNSGGGGIAVGYSFSGGSASISNSTVSDNKTYGNFSPGGGLLTYRLAELNNSIISGNSTSGERSFGGGIQVSFIRERFSGIGPPTYFTAPGVVFINQSTVSGNHTTGADAAGGGINSGFATLYDSTVSENTTSAEGAGGGGVSAFNRVNLLNSTVSGNSTAGDEAHGGGVESNGIVHVIQSTVTDNHSTGTGSQGGGIWSEDDSVEIYGSIIASNSSGGSNPDLQSGTGTLMLDYSLIGDTSGTAITGSTGVGNILDDDPELGLLGANGGPTQTHALLAGSPAIDTGDPNFDPSVLTLDGTIPDVVSDQRGAPFVRVFNDPAAIGSGIDIGAYERQTVNSLFFSVNTPNDELDYTNFEVSLREAINSANGSVGANTIVFNSIVFGDMSGNPPIELELGELVVTEELTIDASGFTDNVIIDAQQQSRVFNFTATTGDFTLVGLTIQNGKTTGDNVNFSNNTHFSGGGIRFLSDGTLMLTNSTVSGNRTTSEGNGGGIVTYSGAVVLNNSTLSGNSTSSEENFATGGGIFTLSGSVTLTNSTLSGNSTSGIYAEGGGISTSSGNVTLTNSTVSGNSTAGRRAYGGGIQTITGNVTLTNSTLSGNSTSENYSYGGGIYTSSGNVTLTNSTLSGNTTSGEFAPGGGIFTSSGLVTLIGSTLSGNSTTGVSSGGGGIYASSDTVTISSSTVSGNYTAGTNSNGGGIFIYDSGTGASLTITNSVVAGNTVAVGNDGPDFVPNTNGTLTVDFSLIGNNAGTTLTEAPFGSPDANGNLIGGPTNGLIDPLLGVLGENGGATQTHALLPGSPAIDAGDPFFDPNNFVPPLLNDQRGAPFLRVFDDPIAAGSGIDIGAFELQPVPAPLVLSGDVTIPIVPEPAIAPVDIEQLANAAKEHLSESLSDSSATALLSNTQIVLAELSSGLLGLTVGNTIYIDNNASGIGWFIDDTPKSDSEYRVVDKVFEALESSPANGRVDLLTVLIHEMGHVLGETDHFRHDDAHDWMFGELAPSVRRLVHAQAVDAAIAFEDSFRQI